MRDHDASVTPVCGMAHDVGQDEERLAELDGYGILDTTPEPDFDDIAQLAAHVCEAPTALVSLVARGRQWFKARIGFDPAETDLERSICRHVLTEPDLLVIPDLTQDERTRANPLVTGAPGLRFYAGAPLRTPSGQVLGSLCVIDTVARPGGLTPPQAQMVRILARQVMGLMELRRAVTGRDLRLIRQRQTERRLGEGAAQLRLSVAHWRGLFERLTEGFIIGQVIRDEAGAIVDWIFADVNAAWGELVGVAPADAIGRRVREVFPGIADEKVLQFAQVVEGGTPVVFTHEVEDRQRWYDARAFMLDAERFAVTFLEVTARVAADRRRDAILRLNDRLRDLDTDAAIIQAAGAILGELLGAHRMGFARLDAAGESVTVQDDWAAPGMDSASGRHRLADYGRLQDAVAGPHPLVIDDVLTDERTAARPGALLRLGTRSLVNIPVQGRERTVAVFFVHAPDARHWTPEVVAFLRNVADRIEMAVARLKAEADQRLLNEELSHRLKNTLAMVQAIAMQTLKGVTERDAVSNFSQRLLALSQAHDVLLRQSWAAGPVHSVIEGALGRLAQRERFDIAGPDLMLGPRTTLSLSLLLHELTTNAVKYGALSSEAGRISVRWRVKECLDGPEMVLDWHESGGPPVAPPERRGFGSRLISSGLVGTGGVELRYLGSGLQVEMRAPLEHVVAS